MQRSAGILLHLTSLPGPWPFGDLGKQAFEFVDFLEQAGHSVWQILPLGPTGYGHSPYNTLSAFAGNTALIDLQQLVAVQDLERAPVEAAGNDCRGASINHAYEIKHDLLETAAKNFFARRTPGRFENYTRFCRQNADWLEDFCLFMAIKDAFNGQHWSDWPEGFRQHRQQAIADWREGNAERCDLYKYQQYVFYEQWHKLKSYANGKGVQIFGDIPIFVAHDSADVWANQHLFQLNAEGQPLAVSGVPPDYFSKTGQRWGNPLYNWDDHLAEDFRWWIRRFTHQLLQCDMIRIDHFRGFQACWSIPADETTAVNGHWEAVPGRELLDKLKAINARMPIIAEDLGIITADVEKLRDDFGLPGMKILQFAFDSGPDNPYLPENHAANSVVYTGTHDNDTTLGWWRSLSKGLKDRIRDYLGKRRPEMPWDLIELAMASRAGLCIIPCQDILGLDKSARLNTPGRASGNWQWQLSRDALTDDLSRRLRKLAEKHHRCRSYAR
jgi:4-alpha-glucanotransferase